MNNKKEILLLLVFALLFSILTLVNLKLLFITIVSPIFIFVLFLLGIIIGVIFKKNIKSILLEQNYLYCFFTYFIAGNFTIISFFCINNGFIHTKSKEKIYKIVDKQNFHKQINGEFLVFIDLKLTKHKNKKLLISTTKEDFINDITLVKILESEGNLGFKVIKNIVPLRISNPK